jgi:hypothetical protein
MRESSWTASEDNSGVATGLGLGLIEELADVVMALS